MKPEEMNEQEMRDSKVPTPENLDQLMSYIDALAKREHDYGTCVYAMSMAAVAAFNYMSGKLGVTGFQASCADMDILTRTRSLKSGFMIVDYDKVMYPQYSPLTDVRKALTEAMSSDGAKEKARKNLTENSAADSVKEHWQRIVDGTAIVR